MAAPLSLKCPKASVGAIVPCCTERTFSA